MPHGKPSHVKDSHNGLCVANHPIADKCEGFRERFGQHLDEFVRLPRMRAGGQVGGPKKVNAFVCKTGRCPYSGKTLDSSRFHTYLLEQLTPGAVLRILPRIQPTGGDLDEGAVPRLSKLLN